MNYTVTGEDLDSIATCWSNSAPGLNWSSVFVLPAWLKAWWQAFSPGAESLIRTVRHGEKIIGIAPLMVVGRTALFIGDTDVCDYLDFIVEPGKEEIFYRALLEDLKKNGIDRLDLKNVRPDSSVMTGLAPAVKNRGNEVVISKEDVSVEMDLPGTWEKYLEGLDGKQRHEVKRKLRRLAGAGDPVYRIVAEKASISAAMDSFFRMFVESRSDKAHFLTEQMARYFRSLAGAMADIGLLKIGVLELDKKAVAEIMYFDYNNSIYLYNSGYNPEYTSLSAGLMSKIFAIKHSIEKGKKRFDFLKGAETYKYHLGGREIPLYRCQIALQ